MTVSALQPMNICFKVQDVLLYFDQNEVLLVAVFFCRDDSFMIYSNYKAFLSLFEMNKPIKM